MIEFAVIALAVFGFPAAAVVIFRSIRTGVRAYHLIEPEVRRYEELGEDDVRLVTVRHELERDRAAR